MLACYSFNLERNDSVREQQSQNFILQCNLCTRANSCFVFSGLSSVIALCCPKTTCALFGNSGSFSAGGGDAGLTTLL